MKSGYNESGCWEAAGSLESSYLGVDWKLLGANHGPKAVCQSLAAPV